MAKAKQRFGWAGPNLARKAWDLMGDRFEPFRIRGRTESSAGKRFAAWDFSRKMLGGDLPNVAQEIGDCVSQGLKHAIDLLQIIEILVKGDRETFHATFAPFFYGISRVQIGGGKINGDGSLGIWGAEGVKQYGVLPADAPGCPAYSGPVAKKWGNRPGPPDNFVALAKPHLIKSAARVTSYTELRDGLFNGYTATIASMTGYAMKLKDEHGKSWFTGKDQWPHQMHISAYDETGQGGAAVYRGNSWGPNAHGPQLDGPAGGGWIHAEDLDKELRNGDTECFLLSLFDGFPARKLRHLLG